MPATDVDFFFGRWRVSHRRLKARLCGSDTWESFEGTCDARPLMDGAANLDDNVLELPGGRYRAVTLRSFDAASDTWAIWWLDARHPHQLDVPVVGRFHNGVGEFVADDHLNGQPIKVRFLWRVRGPQRADVARWEQAFSADGGATWETNWEMDFHRVNG
jgi:hypothetical protein